MANVLKKQDSEQARTDSARAIAGLAGFNLSDLADEGKMRLDECRRQITQMLDEAKVAADQIRAEAKSEGYEEGMRQATIDSDQRIMEQAEIRARDGLERLTRGVEHLHSTYEEWMHQYAESLSRISMAAAERIVRHDLSANRELIVRWAEEAIQGARSANQLTLAVHPETLAQLGGAFDHLLASPGLPEQTRVIADESVDRDSVVVRQPGGEIHAGLQSQLLRLQEMLS